MNAKYYADNVDRALESRAAIPSESEYLHESFKRFTSVASTKPPQASAGLSGLEKIKVMMFRDKLLKVVMFRDNLLACKQSLPYSLLSEIDDWTEAHFEELIKKSPRAATRLLMAYRESKFFLDICLEADNPTDEAITMPEPKKNKLNVRMHPA